MKKIGLLLFIIFSLNYVYAGEISLHGFGLSTYSSRAKNNDKMRDLIVSEERLRLNISSFSENGSAGFNAKADFIHDGLSNETKVDLREAYIDIIEKYYDVRIGKQVITWGLGDLLFINDIFPKDWNAFYAGQDMEYLKLGAEAIKLGIYPKLASIELVVMPAFQPDETPSDEKFIFNNPYSNITKIILEKPDKKIGDTELALRIYRKVVAGDLSLYAYHGFFHTPSAISDTAQVTYFYPSLNVHGASYEINGLGGVICAEAGFYDSEDDRNGDNPAIGNSAYKYLLGYGRQMTSGLHLKIQYYLESMQDYRKYEDNLPPGFPREDKNKQVITFRLTQFLKYETWKLSLFGFYGINEEDYMFIPEVSYKMTDELSLTAGGNIIEGKDEFTTFGRFEENDNVYMRMKYDF